MSLHSSYGPNPIENLPLTDPKCNNDSCAAFQAAHNHSQATVSYTHQFEYGHWAAWYYAIIICIFSLVHVYRWYYAIGAERTRSTSILHTARSKAIAAVRYLSYRRLRGTTFDQLGLPSYGVLALLILSILFICILTFAVRPYYRGHRGYGSPPLAIRTGLMAASYTPLIIALSGKTNFITLLTGVGHERLNIFHRWAGWICLGLSVVHTVPFIVAPLRDGGYAALHRQFYEAGSFEYTGVPPLAILFAITLFSIPFIRRRFYESFYFLHIILYIVYLGLCFWHFGQEGDSWAYLWATLAIFLATLLGRVFWFNRSFNLKGRWMIGIPTELKACQGGMTKLYVKTTPEDFRWRPGQHCFLRFPGLEPLGNHPFTIASAYVESHDTGRTSSEVKDHKSLLTFFIRSHSGFTRKLTAYASQFAEASAKVWIEGPYGGLPYAVENAYDTIILVSGGGGVTACLPWLQHLTSKRNRNLDIRTTAVKFVWVVRAAEHLNWIADSLDELKRMVDERSGFLETQLFVTNHVHVDEGIVDERKPTAQSVQSEEPEIAACLAKDEIDVEADKMKSPSHRTPSYTIGRPHMKDILPSLIASAGKTLIIGCGPESLKTDLSNACAALQLYVLKGEVEEVALHTETFGW